MSIKIGKYTLSILQFEGDSAPAMEVWIQTESGEGGSFSLEKLEAAIDEFYSEHF